jgi:hypothetical protein
MHPNLDAATRGLSDFLESKIVKKHTHQTALIFFGTTATANPAAEEQASKGEMGEYAHITVAHEMRVPDIMQIASLRRGTGFAACFRAHTSFRYGTASKP